MLLARKGHAPIQPKTFVKYLSFAVVLLPGYAVLAIFNVDIFLVVTCTKKRVFSLRAILQFELPFMYSGRIRYIFTKGIQRRRCVILIGAHLKINI